MKTKSIAERIRSLTLLMLAAVLFFFTIGCQETLVTYETDPINVEADTESFVVYPTGTYAEALNGTVAILFPPNAVAEPIEFSITPFPAPQLDGFNFMNPGIRIQSLYPVNLSGKNVVITMKYKLSSLNETPANEEKMTIYSLESFQSAPFTTEDRDDSPLVANVDFQGDEIQLTSCTIESLNNCCVNCCDKTIRGCISECGIYVVGE
ncbi:MAG: hypothetical protein ABFS38_14950 [Bacteroidota bacterium]